MKNNKYHVWYMAIVNNAIFSNRKKNDGVYYEMHHIIPKSLGGTDDIHNLVLLTAKEHVICHHLLTKFTNGKDKSKMLYAYWSLINGWGEKRRPHRVTPRQYEALREEVAKLISQNNTGRVGIPCSDENREAARKRMLEKNPMKNSIPWNKGLKSPGSGGRKKGSKWSEEERQRQLEIRSQPGYYDFLKNPERGKKISDSQRGRVGSSTGTIWCNDGTSEYQVTEIPVGMNKGRLISNAAKIGLRWFNNGEINKQYRDGHQPEGFIHGKISKK